MRKLLWILIGLPLAVVVMALAVVNNQPVTIALDPFSPATPLISITVPLYAVVFVSLLAGVLVGGIATWTGQGRFRRAARVNRREAARWQGEAERLKEAVAIETGPGLPRLPGRKAA